MPCSGRSGSNCTGCQIAESTATAGSCRANCGPRALELALADQAPRADQVEVDPYVQRDCRDAQAVTSLATTGACATTPKDWLDIGLVVTLREVEHRRRGQADQRHQLKRVGQAHQVGEQAGDSGPEQAPAGYSPASASRMPYRGSATASGSRPSHRRDQWYRRQGTCPARSAPVATGRAARRRSGGNAHCRRKRSPG